MIVITRDMAAESANRLGCSTAAVLAVAEVESANSGYLPDGRPAILFEAHWFHKLTKGRFDTAYPGLSSPVWDRSLYKGGAAEWGRLNAAATLDKEAAWQSASWGAFQIMGFQWKVCGFANVTDFVAAMKGPIENHLRAFEAFIAADKRLKAAIIGRDWKAFALHYNGPGAVASYSAKMADAYAKYAGQPDRAEAGPPLPVADPTLKPKPPLTSQTVLTTAAATVGTTSIIVENAKPTIDAIQYTADTIKQATTTWDSVKDAFAIFNNGHVLTVAVLLLVVGALGYIAWRRFRQGPAAPL